MIVALPAPFPVTTPDEAFTDATAGLLLLQVPPLAPLLAKVVDRPAHTVDAPEITPAFGNGLTVMLTDFVDVAHADVTE